MVLELMCRQCRLVRLVGSTVGATIGLLEWRFGQVRAPILPRRISIRLHDDERDDYRAAA